MTTPDPSATAASGGIDPDSVTLKELAEATLDVLESVRDFMLQSDGPGYPRDLETVCRVLATRADTRADAPVAGYREAVTYLESQARIHLKQSKEWPEHKADAINAMSLALQYAAVIRRMGGLPTAQNDQTALTPPAPALADCSNKPQRIGLAPDAISNDANSDGDGRLYPCHKCGKLRTGAEGGATFTVCDTCEDSNRPALAGRGEGEDEVIERMAKAMYQAKEIGRVGIVAAVNYSERWASLSPILQSPYRTMARAALGARAGER